MSGVKIPHLWQHVNEDSRKQYAASKAHHGCHKSLHPQHASLLQKTNLQKQFFSYSFCVKRTFSFDLSSISLQLNNAQLVSSTKKTNGVKTKTANTLLLLLIVEIIGEMIMIFNEINALIMKTERVTKTSIKMEAKSLGTVVEAQFV